MNQALPKIQIVKRLPSNNLGHDFVVGDVHGCYSLLMELLEKSNFDSEKDRLFLVGDLVDRGPEPLACLSLLDEPWCYSVMGNHEEMLLCAFWESMYPQAYLPDFFVSRADNIALNGGLWVLDQYPCMSDEFLHMLEQVWRLPHLIVVGEGDARFNVVHAELPNQFTDYDIDELPSQITLDECSDYRSELRSFRWKRTIMESLDDNTKPVQIGLSNTFTGHTIAGKVRHAMSHICLDTGAFRSATNPDNHLTMMNAITGEVLEAKFTPHSSSDDLSSSDNLLCLV